MANLSLKTNVNLSLVPSSLSSLSSQGSGLLQQSNLRNPFLSNSGSKKDAAASSTPGKTSLSSTLSRLTLKHDTSSKKISGCVEKNNISLTIDAPKTVSSSSSALSRKRGLKSGDVTLKKKIVERKNSEATALIVKRHTIKPPDYSIKSGREQEFEYLNQSKFAVSQFEVDLKTSVGKSLTDIAALKVHMKKSLSYTFIIFVINPSFEKKRYL